MKRILFGVTLAGALLASVLLVFLWRRARLVPSSAATPRLHQGMSFVTWWTGVYRTAEADQALEALAATGSEWVSLLVTGYQDYATSTIIARTLENTPSDEDLAHVIAKAHSLGLKVMLKPHIDLLNDPTHWRGDIGFSTEADWQAWFAAYRDFIYHYADLAQEQGAEEFCIGTELGGTAHREKEWREIVAGARQRFSGALTYASSAGGQEHAILWWDALDYIGVDAYYPLTDRADPTLEELKAAWQEPLGRLEALSREYHKPILFTEIGYRSADGANMAPWVWENRGVVDLEEQALCYRAALEVFWGKPWFAGMYWWAWDAFPRGPSRDDDGYSPRDKPAEGVLRSYYKNKK